MIIASRQGRATTAFPFGKKAEDPQLLYYVIQTVKSGLYSRGFTISCK